MRQTDYIREEPSRDNLAPDDVIRCKDGKTYRTIVVVDGDTAIVKGGNGLVETLTLEAICTHWMKMVPLEQ